MLVVCVLYDIPKTRKFPVWNYFQFCLTAKQADRLIKIISLCVHVLPGWDSIHFAIFRAKVRETAGSCSNLCSTVLKNITCN